MGALLGGLKRWSHSLMQIALVSVNVACEYCINSICSYQVHIFPVIYLLLSLTVADLTLYSAEQWKCLLAQASALSDLEAWLSECGTKSRSSPSAPDFQASTPQILYSLFSRARRINRETPSQGMPLFVGSRWTATGSFSEARCAGQRSSP
ncbi:hypothetical protein GQ44DRAFT_713366 [Phaeosphaeriaceae sp. PMI808]|nr:hypothetical protein GQ44DRAFT_713366 [Phaeosphaeriaceae sp. PMI808]